MGSVATTAMGSVAMTAKGVGCYGIKTQKSSNERLFILTRTHGTHIFGEIPFVKPQNDT